MNKDEKKTINIFLRYSLILILGSFNLYIIYKILTPLTIQATSLAIRIFTPTILTSNIIQFNQTTIQIVPACVAGSAFYLLLVLFLSLSTMSPKARLRAILTALTALFTLNITRILFLASIANYPSFETIHWIFWHIVSTIFVVAIYIATIRYYKIKQLPIISDLKYLNSLRKR